MREPRTVAVYFKDMLDATEKALSFTAGLDSDRFFENEEKVLAVTRLLEIIGEAAKNVPDTVRAGHPDVPWRKITGTRDRLIHAYFQVDADQVWSTVENDLPVLRSSLRRILDEERAG
ncbi:MAG: DUF86 domain-containing protein [Methanospirillum sp.]